VAYIVVSIFVATVGCALLQGWLIRQLRNHYSRPLPAWPVDQPWPKAAIILSLRGPDPFLGTCLRNLIEQDYPDFFVQVVIDSDIDPAWEALRAVQGEFGSHRLRISTLQQRRSDCSLKNSSIIQAVNLLPNETEIVVLVDADAVTHPTWLRELVTPMSDPEVGCATGVRWFAPDEMTLGTRLRCYWNLIAAAVIYYSGTPWGGSMAIRKSLLDSGLAGEWSHMFCEDVHTLNYLHRRRMKLACVPQVTVVNRETTTVGGCLKFVNRQMLIFRLYHPQWWAAVTMILLTALLRFSHYFFIAQTFIYGDWLSFLALVLIRPINLYVTRYEAAQLDQAVRTMLAQSGQEVPRNPVPEFFGYLTAEAMFLTSMCYALGARFVNWRGITYRVYGPSRVKMLSYHPYQATLVGAPNGSHHASVI